MLGAAAVHEFGRLTTKLRASYGKGIRPAGTAVRATWLARESLTQTGLAPEEQSGLEAGVDAFVGGAFALHLTRFDQHAYNLIQPVAIASSLTPYQADGGADRLMYALQNVGEITNRGWELESAVNAGKLSLTGTLSLVDSRVRRLALGYTGDLRPGDRMLAEFGLWNHARRKRSEPQAEFQTIRFLLAIVGDEDLRTFRSGIASRIR